MADTAEDDDDLLVRAIALSLSPQTQGEDRPDVLVGSTGVRVTPVGEEHVNTNRRRALIAQRKVPWCGPNEELLVMLCSMGISRNAAAKGLYYTGNGSVDEAASWVFDNIDLPELNEPLKIDIRENSDLEAFSSNEEDELQCNPYKMVFIVNTELGMGVGKTAAQVGHAALGIYRILQQDTEHTDMLSQWEDLGEVKIVLKGVDAAHLFDLQDQSRKLHLPCYLVHDAGRTQIAAGSVTCLAVMGTASEVDKISGKLKLL